MKLSNQKDLTTKLSIPDRFSDLTGSKDGFVFSSKQFF
jgi:hypothetical protein